MIYGGLFHAPLVYNWLRLAARLFPKQTVSHLLAKVVLDQTCFAPVGLSMFYVGLSALEGKDREGIYKEWREKFPNTWAVSLQYCTLSEELDISGITPGVTQLNPIFPACKFSPYFSYDLITFRLAH